MIRSLAGLALAVLLTACAAPPGPGDEGPTVVALGNGVVATLALRHSGAEDLAPVVEAEMARLLGARADGMALASARVPLVVRGRFLSDTAIGWEVVGLDGRRIAAFETVVGSRTRARGLTRSELTGLGWLSAYDLVAQPGVRALLDAR